MKLKTLLLILFASGCMTQTVRAIDAVDQKIPEGLDVLPEPVDVAIPINPGILGCGEIFKPAPTKSIQCPCNGLTWGWYQHSCKFHIDFVGCGGAPPVSPGNPYCNPYQGDTPCQKWKPILCINKQRVNRPAYTVSTGQQFYSGWTGGHLALTPPVQGCRLTSSAAADKFCRYYFGCGWQMAEHHDGYYTSSMNGSVDADNSWSTPSWPTATGGWRFWGMSNIQRICSANPRPPTRFWVKINDQPGNCWDKFCIKPIPTDPAQVKARA